MSGNWRGWRVTGSGHVPVGIVVVAVIWFTNALPLWQGLLIAAAVGLLLRPVFKRMGWEERRGAEPEATRSSMDTSHG